MKIKSLLTLICAVVAVSASAQQKAQPEWLKSANIYHIYPSSDMDSNGD